MTLEYLQERKETRDLRGFKVKQGLQALMVFKVRPVSKELMELTGFKELLEPKGSTVLMGSKVRLELLV